MTTFEGLEELLVSTGGVLRYDPSQGMFRLEYKRANTMVAKTLEELVDNAIAMGIREATR